jgi:hypothetical protein
MVTNLPAEARKKWMEVSQARDPEERLRLMGEFLSLVPKHKGTAKLCAHVRRLMSQLRDEVERRKRRIRRGRAPSYYPEKSGAAQVIVLGPTNVGRSSLLRAVTNAEPEEAPYPFTTRRPIPGMLHYEDVQIQLVEAPPLVEGASEGRGDGYRVLSLARNGDGLIIMVDLADDPVEQYRMVSSELEKARILTLKPRGGVSIERRRFGSDIQFIWEGELEGCTAGDVASLLRSYGIRAAVVRVRGVVTLDDVEDAIYGASVYRPTLVVANKADLDINPVALRALRKVVGPLELMVASTMKGRELAEKLGSKLFSLLGLIRVYTKEPGGRPSPRPFVLKRGTTIGELAKMIHSDLHRDFRYARLWGPSARFPGERVGPDRVLDDGDIVEIHI